MGAVERFTSFFVGEASVRKTPEREAANDAAFEVKPVTLDDVKQRGMWTNAKGENVRVNPDTMTIEKYANGGTIFFGSLEDMRKDLEQGPYTLVLSQVASEKTVPDDGDIVVAEAVNDPIVAVSQKGGQKTIDRGKARGAKGERNRSKKQGGRGGNGGPGDGDGTDDVAEMDRLLANATTPEETKTLSGVAFVPNIQPLALAKKENVSPAAAPAVSKPAEVVDMATHETGEVPAPTQVEVAPEWRKKLDEFLGRPDGEGLAQKIGEIIVSERKQFNIKIVEKIQKKGEFVTSKREWETWNTSMAPALKRFIAKEYFSYLGIDDNTGKKIVGGIRRFLNEEAKNSSTQGDDVFEQRRMPKDVVYLGEKEYEALVTEAIAAMKERVKSQAASDIPTDPEILEQGKFEDAMRESLRNFRELPNGEDIVKKIEDLLIEESREFHETFPEKVREQNFRLSSKVDLQKLFSEEFLAIIEEKIVKKLLEQKKISTEDEGKKLFWAIEWNLRQGDITR